MKDNFSIDYGVEMAEQIVKLNEENKVLKRALELCCYFAMPYKGTELFHYVSDFVREKKLHSDSYISNDDVYDYFIDLSNKQLDF